MKLVRIAGVFVVILGMLAVGALAAPSVYGQSRRVQRDVLVAPQIEVFGGGSTIGVSVGEVEQADVAKYKLPAPGGAIIDEVRPGTPAEKAGLRSGDVVVEFDGERVRSAAQFGRLVRETPSGRAVKMVVVRNGQKATVDITPEGRPTLGSAMSDIAPAIVGAVGDRMSLLGRQLELKLGNLEKLADLDVMAGKLRRGRLGVTLQELTPQLADYFGTRDGALVTSVAENSPAASAGLKAGDIITAVDDRVVDRVSDVTLAVARAREEAITIRVVRDKKELTLKATLEPTEIRRKRLVRVME
ncbi:MAG: PDZ domain-containing protein [Acidobacteria bacterium]|nr:PDZ domain-containing protein [Acidobacteriota bacterium]